MTVIVFLSVWVSDFFCYWYLGPHFGVHTIGRTINFHEKLIKYLYAYFRYENRAILQIVSERDRETSNLFAATEFVFDLCIYTASETV